LEDWKFTKEGRKNNDLLNETENITTFTTATLIWLKKTNPGI